jgi:oxygen-independent coproporphyrinogen-3 oxidase
MKTAGVYIHIPYCLRKCLYCDFVSCADMAHTQKNYVAALVKEAGFYSEKLRDYTVETVYLGGGTPSVLFAGGIYMVLEAVKQNFSVATGAEITVEVNPETVTADKAAEYIAAGISRFSVGLQSSEAPALRAAGRMHTFEDFLEAVAVLRKYGAKNISADMMLGLPVQTVRGAAETADALVKLKLQHVSAYGLQLEEGTPLYKAAAEKKCVLPSEDESADMYDVALEIFEKAGIRRYEVSSFAQEGFACRHNLNYWRRGQYLGLGVAAHGFLGGSRIENIRDIPGYIQKIAGGHTGGIKEEKISSTDAQKEYIMLALRLEEGLDTEKFEEFFFVDFFEKYERVLEKLHAAGLIYFEGRFLKIPREKSRVLNRIIVEFF